MIMISNFYLNFTNFFVIVLCFLTKLLTLGILYLIAGRAVVVPKLVILDILPLVSFISSLRAAVVVKLLILGISHIASFIF